jgi:hypothetical protein
METQYSHRGVRPTGPLAHPVDRRIVELDNALRAVEVSASTVPNVGFMRDSQRAAQMKADSLDAAGHFCRGVVVHALPHLNWYKVQVGAVGGWMPCCKLGGSGLVPPGPRNMELLPAYSHVLVYKPRGLNHGYIVGPLPPALADGALACPDWVLQAGGGGLKREEAHKFPVKGLFRQGGTINWSAGRPLDETAFQQGWVTPTGLALTVSDFMIQMRVNEMCGLWCNIFDGHTRLAGQQLVTESAVEGHHSYCDEGESRVTRGVAAYPWEALGQYSRDTPFTEEYAAAEVQYGLHRGAVDVGQSDDDIQPLYRYVEHNGYSGPMRAVVLPARTSGLRHYGEREVDEGLFRESIGLDGSYQLLSAKSLHIGKRVRVIVPREVMPPDDGRGDDARADNYRFSGLYGTAEPHAVRDLQFGGQEPQMRKAAAVHDVIANDLNWKALHAFHYHRGDYELPQEDAGGPFARGQEELDFGRLGVGYPFVLPPVPRPLTVDHRYGSVSYFERESFLRFEDDGTVILAGGAGETITLAGGDVELSCPGKVKVLPGTDLLAFAGQMCFRSRGSVDIDSSDADVRVKAQQNFHCLAGNSGVGGILLESKAVGKQQLYRNRFGEDVVSSGIVLLAPDSIVATLAGEIYLRTGGHPRLGSGDITVDAGRGKQRVNIISRQLRCYMEEVASFDFGTLGDRANITGSYVFTATTAVFDAALLLGGQLTGYGDQSGIVMRGNIEVTGSVSAAGTVSDSQGSYLGRVSEDYSSELEGTVAETSDVYATVAQQAASRHKLEIVTDIYQDGLLQDDELLRTIGFSYRDPPRGDQYVVSRLVWPESRWQQMARFGLATGGRPWDETPVLYQGAQTFPYPGRRKWLGEASFYQSPVPQFHNPATGFAADRPYNATLNDWRRVPMSQGYTLIR